MTVYWLLPRTSLLLLLVLWGVVPGVAQTPSFWERVLRIIGVSATPSALRGTEEGAVAGDLWVATVAKGVRQRLTWEGTYRSPVFLRGDEAILALQANYAIRIPTYGGEVQTLYPLAGVVKLVGVSKDDPDKVLVLTRDAQQRLAVGLLSLGNSQVAPIAYNPASQRDQSMLTHLAGWNREYGKTMVSVKSVSTAAGAVQHTDVYLKRENTEPVNISTCDGATCGQPSLSHDGKRVVFVKTARP